jgi:hypothetical protein
MSNVDEALAELGERLHGIQELLEETLTDPSKPQFERYKELGESVHEVAPWASAYDEALEEWRANRTTLFEWTTTATATLSNVREELEGVATSLTGIAASLAQRPTAATPLWVVNLLLLLILWRVW